MNSQTLEAQLLVAIRHSKKRLLPAIEKQHYKNPLKDLFFKYVRVLSPLREIPISIDKNYRFFLDGSISPNSKAGAAFREFIAVGINKDQIWHNALRPASGLNKVVRVIFRLPWLFMIFIINRRVLRVFDLVALQVFVGYLAYKRFFFMHKELIPIIISDISPTLHMQWIAALARKQKVFWWQDDYHHYSGFSSENYMPYPCAIAAVLNQNGLETVLQMNPQAKVFGRNQTPVKSIKRIPANPKLGVATNVTFKATADQIQYIDQLRRKLDIFEVYFRLHPNSRLTHQQLDAEWMHISPAEEEIEQYCEKVDLVIVGNSAVQLKLLCAGIPVIHTECLDDFGYDLYGYCANDFCYGVKDYNQLNSTQEINLFYQKRELQDNLTDFVNVRTKIPSLSELHNIL